MVRERLKGIADEAADRGLCRDADPRVLPLWECSSSSETYELEQAQERQEAFSACFAYMDHVLQHG